MKFIILFYLFFSINFAIADSPFGKFNPNNPLSEYSSPMGKFNRSNPLSEYNSPTGSFNLNNPRDCYIGSNYTCKWSEQADRCNQL